MAIFQRVESAVLFALAVQPWGLGVGVAGESAHRIFSEETHPLHGRRLLLLLKAGHDLL